MFWSYQLATVYKFLPLHTSKSLNTKILIWCLASLTWQWSECLLPPDAPKRFHGYFTISTDQCSTICSHLMHPRSKLFIYSYYFKCYSKIFLYPENSDPLYFKVVESFHLLMWRFENIADSWCGKKAKYIWILFIKKWYRDKKTSKNIH